MTGTKPIRVLLVDDHTMLRSGLRMFLMAFDDLTLAGEANNGLEAVKLAAQLQPDVILMDLIMPGLDGIHAAREILKKSPEIKIIALTSFTDPHLIHDALEAGVSGYLFKSVSAAELASAIRAAHAGHTIFSPEVTQSLISAAEPPARLGADLTAREHEVLLWMVVGMNNAEIAEKLSLSISTVKFHVSSVLSKLEVRSRGEAIAYALKNRLVNTDGSAKHD